MFNLAIINENKVGIGIDELSSDTIREYLKNIMTDHIVWKDVTNTDEMMDLVISTIGVSGDLIATTIKCYEDADNIYQMCHLSPGKNNIGEDQENINYLSSFLGIGKEIVFGKAILLKSTITPSGICEPSSFNVDDIVNILHRKLAPKCVMIKTDGNIEEINFFSNPFADSLKRDMSDFDSIEVPILNFNLLAYFEKNPTTKVLNRKASKLIGVSKVYGDVVVLMLETENDFGYLEKDLVNGLLTLSSGEMVDRDITDDELKKDDTVDNLPVVINKYRIYKERLSSFKKECANPTCKLALDTSSHVCTGCYRVNYCTKECQADNWSDHKKTCSYGKDYLNPS